MDKKLILKNNNNQSKPKNLLGLKDLGNVVLKCRRCNQELIICQLTKSNEDLCNDGHEPINTNIVADCFCGGFSETKIISGQFYLGAFNDDITFDIFENENNIKLITRRKDG